MKNKKIINLGIALSGLTLVSVVVGNKISDALLKPKKREFKDWLDENSEHEQYDEKYYFDASREEFKVLSEDGYYIVGEYLACPVESDKTIYYLHGYGVNRAEAIWFLKAYHDCGYNVVIYDHIGSGDTGGDFATMGVRESRDLHTVRQFIEKTYGKPAKIALHGMSMGASTAMYYGEIYGDVDCIIADCGYSNMNDIVIHQFKEQFKLPKFPFINLANIGLKLKAGYTLKDVDCLKSVSSENYKDIKLLIIHGRDDKFTPVEMAYELDKACIGEHYLEVIEGAEHATSYKTDPEKYVELMKKVL